MKATTLTHLSLVLFGTAGTVLLFAGADVLPTVFDASDGWLAQLVASGWLAMAMLNWLHRRSVVGGIHGRPLVMSNLVVWVIVSTTLAKAGGAPIPELLRIGVSSVAGLMALTYGWLMMRGPFAADAGR